LKKEVGFKAKAQTSVTSASVQRTLKNRSGDEQWMALRERKGVFQKKSQTTKPIVLAPSVLSQKSTKVRDDEITAANEAHPPQKDASEEVSTTKNLYEALAEPDPVNFAFPLKASSLSLSVRVKPSSIAAIADDDI
jgi:hypothetical protein